MKDERPPEMLLSHRIGTCQEAAVVPGSSEAPCSECGAAVHLSPASRAALAKWPAVRVLCLDCGLPILEARGGGELAAAPGQRAELRAAGMNPRALFREMNRRVR